MNEERIATWPVVRVCQRSAVNTTRPRSVIVVVVSRVLSATYQVPPRRSTTLQSYMHITINYTVGAAEG